LAIVAGFSVVNVALLNPGTILVYIVAMYIGVYPVAISMRNSNVYQVSNKQKINQERGKAHLSLF
jgi:Trk-type K+ transport system membrane component